MARVDTLLEAIADTVRARLPLPALKTCRVHDGRWDAAELKRRTLAAPAAFVFCSGAPRIAAPNEAHTDADCELAVAFIARDKPGEPRGAAARAFAETTMAHLPRDRWGLSGLGPATDMRAENLYSETLDKTGAAMWTVTWRQTLRLDAPTDEVCPPLPGELYSSLAVGALT